MKKNLILMAVLLFSALSCFAQHWEVNFEKAKQLASEQDRPIVVVFQGSDWCAPCIKLNRTVWSTDAFINYANDNYILCKVDFPRDKKNRLSKEQLKQNEKMFERYNKNGFFPFVVVLDKTGKVLGETGYKKTTPEKYIEELNAFLK